jgi:hypothetical protein
MRPMKLAARKKPPKMPMRLQKIYEEIEGELIVLFFRWRIFRQLFATNGERIGLMMASSPIFFCDFQSILIDAIFLQICRVTDKTHKIGKGGVRYDETVVIGQLLGGLGTRQKRLAKKLETRLIDVKSKCEAIRVHRNRRISHTDKLVLLKPSTNVLPNVTLAIVQDAIDSIAGFVNEFRLIFDGSRLLFDATDTTDDGETVIDLLQRAYAFRELTKSDLTLVKLLDEGPFGSA